MKGRGRSAALALSIMMSGLLLIAGPVFADDFRVTVSANIREEPDTASTIVGRVERGMVLRIVAVEGSWIRVIVPATDGPSRVGYIHSTLGAVEVNPPAAAPPAIEAPPIARVPEAAQPSSVTDRTPPPTPSPAPAAALSSPADREAPQFQTAPRPDLDKLDWEMRLERARGRRGTGRNLLIGGLGGALLSWVALSKAAGTGNEDAALAIILGAFGTSGTLAVVGLVKFRGGGSDLRFLEREGRAKGFVTIAPAPRGVMALANVTF